jgi:hypothetical protein
MESRCLLAGIDTLELGFCVEKYLIGESQWKDLAEAKECSRSSDFDNKLATIELCGHEFQVNRGGAQRYGYILRNEDVTLKINEKAQSGIHFPEIQVGLHSGYLWRKGYESAIRESEEWLAQLANIGMVKVSRADLTADIKASMPVLSSDLREIVTRAKNKGLLGRGQFDVGKFYTGLKLSGYRVGSSNLMCRMYDKIAESYKSRKTWFEELWAKEGWQIGDPVTRVEFQLRRPFLRQMQTDSPYDLIAQAPDLWRYLTRNWLTLRAPGDDSHRNRWPVSELWKVVQGAGNKFGEVTGIRRIHQMRPTIDGLIRMNRGTLVSIVTLLEASSAGKERRLIKQEVIKMIEDMLRDSTFDMDVERRKAKYSGMDN